MKCALRGVAVVAATAALSACAGGSFSYQDPGPAAQVENEIVVDEDFDRMWEGYVSELSKSFFVINNIERDSGIINVSFSTDSPREYADCGTTTLTSRHPARGEQTFRYNVAESSSMWVGVDGTNHIYNRNRSTKLEGRANIYMAPRGEDRTLVRVNARYSLGITVRENGVTAPYNNVVQTSVGFSTGQTEGESDGIMCTPTGKLERRLIEMAKTAAAS